MVQSYYCYLVSWSRLRSRFYYRFSGGGGTKTIAVCILAFFALLFYFLTSLAIIGNVPAEKHGSIKLVDRIFTKTILLWTGWFDDPEWGEVFNTLYEETGRRQMLALDDDFHNGDPRLCQLTTDRRWLTRADLLLFHGRDLDDNDLPSVDARQQRQLYAFLSLEPPPMVYTEFKWELLKTQLQFNWTATYMSGADVRFPYSRIVTVETTAPQSAQQLDKIKQFVKNFASRKKDAVWIVSHCKTDSGREKLVEKLQQLGVKIDIFGKCSGNLAPPWNNAGSFFADYRYYLSFENSLCDDYVTEKLFRGLQLSRQQGVIPLAYGGAVDYTKLGIPTGSFIQVRDFLPNNLTELAHFLTEKLPNDKTTLEQFFKWHLNHEFGDPVFIYSWRRLCEALWENDNSNEPKIVEDVRATFGTCYSPVEFS